jgi:RNA polymerase sigma factor for flagellar operon FliA
MMTASEAASTANSPVVLSRLRDGLPMVDVICHQVRRRYGVTVRLEDLVSYGREGLLAAARSFDPRRGVPFKRWANLRVRGAVIDGIRATSAVPRSMYSRLRTTEEEGRVGGEGDSGRAAAVADRRLSEYLARRATAIALGFVGARADEHGEPIDRSPSAEQSLLRHELFEAIRASVSELPEAERTLVERHYFDGVTFEEAATELGLSKSWASRLHARAIGYITRSLKRSRWI